MPAMFSYPHRQKSGQITCYLNRTYHVLTTAPIYAVAAAIFLCYLARYNVNGNPLLGFAALP